MLTSGDSLFGNLLVVSLPESFHNLKIDANDSLRKKISNLIKIVDRVTSIK